MNKCHLHKTPGDESPWDEPIIAREVTYIRMWGGGCHTKGSFIYAFS